MPRPKPHFLLSPTWASFWASSMDETHSFFFEIASKGDYEIQACVYVYPWVLGQSFWYLPRTFFIQNLQQITDKVEGKEADTQVLGGNYPDREKTKELVAKILNQILQKAKETNPKPTFIKLDLDPETAKYLGLGSIQELIDFLTKILNSHLPLSRGGLAESGVLESKPREVAKGIQIAPSKKKLQYSQTVVINVPKLNTPTQNQLIKGSHTSNLSLDDLQSFLDQNSDLYGQFNQNLRRYTKKSLTKNWTVSIIKSKTNFESFWEVYQKTATRQEFSTHSKDYFFNLMKEKSSQIIVLYDQNGKPQSCWMGLFYEQTLTYLYGGNTDFSFENYGQYLIHLVAFYLVMMRQNLEQTELYQKNIEKLKCDFPQDFSYQQILFYDLGGYDPNYSYSKFKEAFRGEAVNYLGPVDLVLRPRTFKVSQGLISGVKGLRRFFKN